MGLYEDANGYRLVNDYVTQEAQTISELIRAQILIDDVILRDAYSHAAQSAEFHRIQKINHYKEAGHLTYWINHLKPFRVTVPSTFQSWLAEIIEIPLPAQPVTQSDYDASRFPINEHIALTTGLRIIEYAEDKLIKDCIKANKIDEAEISKKRLEEGLLRIQEVSYEVLISSLKRHEYSPRVLATMFHTIFS